MEQVETATWGFYLCCVPEKLAVMLNGCYHSNHMCRQNNQIRMITTIKDTKPVSQAVNLTVMILSLKSSPLSWTSPFNPTTAALEVVWWEALHRRPPLVRQMSRRSRGWPQAWPVWGGRRGRSRSPWCCWSPERGRASRSACSTQRGMLSGSHRLFLSHADLESA